MDVNAVINSNCLLYHSQWEGKVLNNSIMIVTCTWTCEGNSLLLWTKVSGECVWNSHVLIVLEQIIKNSLNIFNKHFLKPFFSVYVSTYYTKNIIVCCTGLSETFKSCDILSHTLILSLQNIVTLFRSASLALSGSAKYDFNLSWSKEFLTIVSMFVRNSHPVEPSGKKVQKETNRI